VIVNERMTAYINSLDTGNSDFLEQLEQEAREQFVPVIRREMQSLLKVLLAVKMPVKLLEIGTAIGFSSLFMLENNPVSCKIDTIENYEKRIVAARENLKRADKNGDIRLLCGDALTVMQGLEESYDFIFMDAAKGQYIHFLPEALRLLSPNGILVSDNVLQDGDIIESRFAVTRRDRTIHKRMREYLYELTHHPMLTTTVLPIGDGATISTKHNDERKG